MLLLYPGELYRLLGASSFWPNIFYIFQNVPTGDWFCPDCRPKEIKRSPLKGRRKTFDEESDKEEEKDSR